MRAATAAALCAGAASAAPKPHLFFFLADDLGWYDLGYRNPRIVSPHLDTLVTKESAVLTRHYVFKYCSPTRRSFLGGRFSPHSGTVNAPPHDLLDLRMTTIATKLKSAGYVTGQAGKWHAGHRLVRETPKGRGFDTSLGYFQGMEDHYTQKFQQCGKAVDLWDTDKPGWGLNGTYGDLMYYGRAVQVIQQHDVSKPLFFYLASQCAHDPVQSPKRFQTLYANQTDPVLQSKITGQYAMSSVIDEGVGNVTSALKAKGMWANTLFVFSSDNGGPAFSDQKAASNWPLRGGKYQLWEGGIRANAFVSGGLLPASMRGTNVSAVMHICDWYATFSKLAGLDTADPIQADGVPPIDGVDQWPVLSGSGAGAADPRTEVWPVAPVLIQGKWKLLAAGGGTPNWAGPLYPQEPAEVPAVAPTCSKQQPCLFDVVADAAERDDVAAAHPGVVAQMTARLQELQKTSFEPTPPNKTTWPDELLCNKTRDNGGFLTPADWTKDWAREL